MGIRSLDSLAVFDLDDTLIDTSGVLVPAALAAVAHAINRDIATLNVRGKRIDEVLEGLKGLTSKQRADAATAWYDPTVPELDVRTGVDEMLRTLSGRIHLALLTRGSAERQWAKIHACNLKHRFDSIRIRDIEREGSKADDLIALMDEFEVAPQRTAVIGDDPSDELHHGAALGCITIRVPQTPITEIVVCLKNGRLLAIKEDSGEDIC